MSKAILEDVSHLSAGVHSGACVKKGRLRWFCALDSDLNLWSRSVELPDGMTAHDVLTLAPSIYGVSLMAANADLWSWDARSGRWTRLGNVAEPPSHAR